MKNAYKKHKFGSTIIRYAMGRENWDKLFETAKKEDVAISLDVIVNDFDLNEWTWYEDIPTLPDEREE